MHKWNMFRRTAPVVLSLVVAAAGTPVTASAADFGDGTVLETEALETAGQEAYDGIFEAGEETSEEEIAEAAEEAEISVEEEEAVFDAGEETAETDPVFADSASAEEGTVTAAGTEYAWSKSAADGYTQIGATGVYYKGTLPAGDYYGTATLTYKEFYNGDVTDITSSQYDTYASATSSKYSICSNEDTTINYEYNEDGSIKTTTQTNSKTGEEETVNVINQDANGYYYYINGVKNVSVKVSAATYVEAEILEAAGALSSADAVYTEASGITLNADPAAAVEQYKTLNADGTYSATTFKTAATVTDAAAVLETSSNWGDYVIEITETSTSYIRNGRSDEGFAVKSDILGAIIKTTDGTAIGLRHCYEIWVQPWELAFSEDTGLAGETISEVDYITPDGVYVYTFADGVYVKTTASSNIGAAFSADGKQIEITGLAGFTNPKVTVYYTEGSGRQAQKYYVVGSSGESAAVTKNANGKYTAALNTDAELSADKEYTMKVTSDNYCDVTVSGISTASGIVNVGSVSYSWTTSDTAVEGYTNIEGTNVYYSGSTMPAADDIYYGTASFTYKELYSGLVSDVNTSQYDTYASATGNKYSICSNEDTEINYTTDESGSKVVTQDANGYYYYIKGAKNVNVAVSGKTYVEAAVLEAAGQLPESGVYAEAAEIALNKDAAAAVSQVKTLKADGTYSALSLNVAATVTDAKLEVVTSSRWGDYVLEVEETSTKNIRNTRQDTGFAVNGDILGVIVKASDGTTVGLRHCYEIWVQPWEVAFSADCGLQGKTITEIDYIMPDATYVYTFSGAYVKPQLPEATKTAVAASIVTGSTEATITGLSAFTNPKVSVYWVEGSGRNSKTTYLAEEAAVTVKDGSATVTLNAAAEADKEYTVKVVSDNYADMTVTAELEAAPTPTVKPSITVKKTVINLALKKTTTLKPTLTGVSGKVTYTSSNKKVATVNSKGKITAKKTGKATITIKCGSVKTKITVYVNEKLTLKKSSATIKVKGKTTIKATTNIKGTITYTSSNTKVATVTKKGVVKGIKKGTATITVKCNGKTKKFKVTVK